MSSLSYRAPFLKTQRRNQVKRVAVYTDVHSTELEALLRRFELGGLRSFRGIAEGVENSNYLVESDNARFILTLYEKRVNPDDLPFFLGLMEHLASRGIPCPLPIRDSTNTSLFELNGRPAAMISYLDGVSIEAPSEDQCQQLGAALAKLHHAQTGFALKRKNALSLTGWAELAQATAPQADSVIADLAGTIQREMAALTAQWAGVEDLPQGVIHADLFPDNVFFLKGQLSGIIDFYFACNDALAFDIAICLNAWCFDAQTQYLPGHAAALIAGYEDMRPLTASERGFLPILARGAAIRFLLTRLYDWLNPAPGALVKPKNPLDYAKRLSHFQSMKVL